MTFRIKFENPDRIEYLKVYVFYKKDGSIDPAKTMQILAKILPEFCEKRDEKIPLSIDSILQYLESRNYERAMTRFVSNKRYCEITFQRDLNEITPRE